MILKCLKCGNEIGHHNPTDWIVCPKCKCCDYYFTIWLKNHNMSFKEAKRKMNECPGLIPAWSIDMVEKIDAAEYARSSIGNISGWALSQFNRIIMEQTGTVCSTNTPPLIGINNQFLKKLRNHTKCCSEAKPSHPCMTGINIPMMQEQNQYVGHSALYAENASDTENFIWRTYLHRFYIDRPRGFLSYRPMNPGFETEILLVDSVHTYLKALGWFDVQAPDPSEEFPRNILPLLILGKAEYALDMLFDYFWEPWRITVLSSNMNLRSDVWDRMNAYRNLKCDNLRIMPDKGFSGWKIRSCRTRADLGDLMREHFYTLEGGNHEKIYNGGGY